MKDTGTESGEKMEVNTPNFINIVNRPFANVNVFEILGVMAVTGAIIVVGWHGVDGVWDQNGIASALVLYIGGMAMLLAGRLDEGGE